MLDQKQVIASTRKWVESVVVGLNLCPFAKKELVKERIRFTVTDATDESQLLAALLEALETLEQNQEIETTLIIHPAVLQDFFDYNQFLDIADALLVEMDLEGVFQIASFHPDYQFGGTNPEDVENYTNRSPYPMLHLLREDSLTRAISSFPDTHKIPEQNIELVRSQGREKMLAMLRACLDS